MLIDQRVKSRMPLPPFLHFIRIHQDLNLPNVVPLFIILESGDRLHHIFGLSYGTIYQSSIVTSDGLQPSDLVATTSESSNK